MFSLPTVREAILTSHARVTGRGRDGTRKDRSTGWSPQTHSGHVVSRTSHSASRFHEINLAGREFRQIGHLVTSFCNFAWCYIWVYCFQKTPQTKWYSPLAACMRTIKNGHHP